MAIPSVDLCGWAVTDVILPVMNKANKEKPIDDLINKGWDMNESPAADEFNYLFNNHYQWINYLKTDIAPVVVNATSSNTPNTIVKRDASGNFSAGTITASLSGNSTTATTSNSCTGNSATATILQTGRTIAVSNAVVSTPTTFNGASNISIPVTSVDASYLTGTVPTASLSGMYNININGNAATATSANTITNNIAILTGTLKNGETIPLPSGYTEAQCKWFVSPGYLFDDGADDIRDFTCTAIGTRVLTLNIEGVANAINFANYMIIGTK